MDLFPYEHIRPIQKELIAAIRNGLKQQKHMLIHAPTGLGKTVSALVPALEHALIGGQRIFFLTNRHTQHKIAIDTIKAINAKHNVHIRCADIVGKQSMCLQEAAANQYNREFTEYCKKLKKEGTCSYYANTYTTKVLSLPASEAIGQLGHQASITEIKEYCEAHELCPYEIATELAKKAQVIIADYYHVFHPHVQFSFLSRVAADLGKSIVIVDEAHNLPDRIRGLLSTRLTMNMLQRTIKEAEHYELFQARDLLQGIRMFFDQASAGERLMSKEMFMEMIEKMLPYDQMLEKLKAAESYVKKRQDRSGFSGIIEFLQEWQGPDEGFVRIMNRHTGNISLDYSCLDPGTATGEVFDEIPCSILMSGTLNPTTMFRDVLRVPDPELHSFPSPFPKENVLRMIIPETSTKFTQRSEQMYKRIGELCSQVIAQTQVRTAIFFPSYDLRNQVSPYITGSDVFTEQATLTRDGKEALLQEFSQSKQGVLLGVAAANFAEGIDLPGDLLECVIVVGLPLERPDLKTKALISYYDALFQKGWDYGYLFPAMNKVFQAAGRCIRTESDKGVVVFLDERYMWQNYIRCFPADWQLVVEDWRGKLQNFAENALFPPE